MQRETYEERTVRVTVAIPKALHNQVIVKLQFSGYTTKSELIRDLLRQWMDKGILEVKPIGRMLE